MLVLQHELGTERDQRARDAVLHQAALVNADLNSVVEGAHQLMLGVSRLPAVQRLDPGCAADLSALRDTRDQYTFIAVLDGAGKVVCAVPGTLAPGTAVPLQDWRAGGDKTLEGAGVLTTMPGFRPFLPILQPLDGKGGSVAVAALSLDWLAAHLAEPGRPSTSTILVADRNGRELGRASVRPSRVGEAIPEQLARLAQAGEAGAIELRLHGEPLAVGYVPATVAPLGLLVVVAASPTELVPGLARAAAQGYAVIGVGFLVALGLAFLIGHRYLRQPTASLLGAARAWEQGDLGARARLRDPEGTEFGDLAAAFNRMAEAFGRQQSELRALNDALEIRVSERTRALLDSNNRLQVVLAERERTEESLRQAQKLQAVGQLAGGIAHDFNNLLTAVTGSLELLARSIGPADTRGQRLLETASQAAARGGRLTAQLLAFSRKQKLVPVPTDINGVVGTMSALLASTLGPAIQIETRLAPDLWPAMTDPNQLEAAILNLALNARDAMPSGGRLVITTAGMTLPAGDLEPGLAGGDYVALNVIDTGTGMAEAVLSRAFEPFFTTKETGEGSGLGLSQVHGLVRQSGGAVRITSKPGAGTRVTLLLPRAVMGAAEVVRPRDAGPTLAGPHVTILLVDDDTEVREVTAEMLQAAGHAVLTASGGAEALALLRGAGSEVGFVVLDYAMPGMNGIELARAIRAERPNLPILLATGYAEISPGEEPAVDGILRKPFRATELLRRIEALLAARSIAAE